MPIMSEEMLLDAPIPGQSLTQSPDTPLPYEQPPEFTDVEKASKWLFDRLTDPDFMPQVVDLLSTGMPVETLTQIVVFNGFKDGKWNPDLMLLLIEPCLYILLFICEVNSVDYILSFDEDDYVDPQEEKEMKVHIGKMVGQKGKQIDTSAVMDVPSLLGMEGEL